MVCASLISCKGTQPTPPSPEVKAMAEKVARLNYASTITEGELKDLLYTYASDDFMGRETGTEGERMATDFLTAHYKEMGISAAQVNGSYLQDVPLEFQKIATGTIEVGSKTLTLGKELIALNAVPTGPMEFVYAPHGIIDSVYSDLKDINLNGKWVVLSLTEPVDENGIFTISGTTTPSSWSGPEGVSPRVTTLMKAGAKGMIIQSDAMLENLAGRFETLKNANTKRMVLKGNDGFAIMVGGNDFVNRLTEDGKTPPTATSLETTANALIDANGENIEAHNVVAYIKGSEKPDEFLVVSAHLDHIGVGKNGDVNNGADDDGSGTVAILEIAEAFQQAAKDGMGPKRSVVFLHVTGEEKGLFGSEHYTNEPIFPLNQTIANLNIDMIGRIDPKREGSRNYVYLIGSDKLSTELHELSEEVNRTYANLELDYKYNDDNDPNRFYYRSDHYNFAKNNIPVIFYFNGTHDDYHRPSDTPDKINYDLLQNRARLVFHTAWELANRESAPVVDKSPE